MVGERGALAAYVVGGRGEEEEKSWRLMRLLLWEVLARGQGGQAGSWERTRRVSG